MNPIEILYVEIFHPHPGFYSGQEDRNPRSMNTCMFTPLEGIIACTDLRIIK